MRVYAIVPNSENACIERDFDGLKVWLENAEVGDEFEIQVLDMTEVEYEALPEYMG